MTSVVPSNMRATHLLDVVVCRSGHVAYFDGVHPSGHPDQGRPVKIPGSKNETTKLLVTFFVPETEPDAVYHTKYTRIQHVMCTTRPFLSEFVLSYHIISYVQQLHVFVLTNGRDGAKNKPRLAGGALSACSLRLHSRTHTHVRVPISARLVLRPHVLFVLADVTSLLAYRTPTRPVGTSHHGKCLRP